MKKTQKIRHNSPLKKLVFVEYLLKITFNVQPENYVLVKKHKKKEKKNALLQLTTIVPPSPYGSIKVTVYEGECRRVSKEVFFSLMLYYKIVEKTG